MAVAETVAEHPGSSMPGVIGQLATSRFMAIAISLATAPILGRLFPPHAFGALGVITTLVSILASFASLSYVSAIPVATTPDERRDLCVISLLVGIGSTMAVVVGAVLGANAVANAFREPAVANYMLFLPLMFIASGMRQLIDTLLSCQRRFGVVALRNVLEVVVTRVTQFGSYFAGLLGSPIALIIGALTGSYVAAAAAGVSSLRETFRTAKDPLCAAKLLATAVKHRDFPLIAFWSQTINAVTFGLPALILGLKYSIEAVGWYGMAYTLVMLPVSLFSSSAGQVFYVETGQRVAQGQSLVHPTQQLVSVLASLISFPMAAVIFLGPLLFETFLGLRWREAGVYAQILAPWVSLTAIWVPLSAVFPVLNRQVEGFVWNVTLLVTRFFALYFGGMMLEIRATLGLYVAVSVIIVACQICRGLYLLAVSRRWAVAIIMRHYVEMLLLLSPASLLYWQCNAPLWAFVALGLACAAFFVLLYFRHPPIIKSMLPRFDGMRLTER